MYYFSVKCIQYVWVLNHGPLGSVSQREKERKAKLSQTVEMKSVRKESTENKNKTIVTNLSNTFQPTEEKYESLKGNVINNKSPEISFRNEKHK